MNTVESRGREDRESRTRPTQHSKGGKPSAELGVDCETQKAEKSKMKHSIQKQFHDPKQKTEMVRKRTSNSYHQRCPRAVETAARKPFQNEDGDRSTELDNESGGAAVGRNGRPEEEGRRGGVAGAEEEDEERIGTGTKAGAWMSSERVPDVESIICSFVGEELRLWDDTRAMEAGDEVEGTSRGALTASLRAG